MDATVEGIGGLKWSIERKQVIDNVLPPSIHAYLMQGRVKVAEIEDARHLPLIVTAPQLWDAANEVARLWNADKISKGTELHYLDRLDKAIQELALLVAKSVGKDDWSRVLQKEEK